MRVHSLSFFVLSLLVNSASFCNADDTWYHVAGSAECGDCKKNKFQNSQAFSGLHVTIECKVKSGETKEVGGGDLDEQGKFRISIPQKIVQEDGQKLKEECYAHLYNAATMPCPVGNGLEDSKIVFKSQYTFAPAKNLQFTVALCTSKTFWPFFDPNHPWFRNFGHPWLLPPFPPVYTPPVVTPPQPPVEPPPSPVYPPPPVVTPPPPPPVNPPKKPCPPTEPPPVNPPKKPCPPTEPKPPPTPPAHKPPKKPCPPKKSEPPIYKPPKEPPYYKPPKEPPVYKPPKEPPVYKPPKKPPLYYPSPMHNPPTIFKPGKKTPVYNPPPIYSPPKS